MAFKYLLYPLIVLNLIACSKTSSSNSNEQVIGSTLESISPGYGEAGTLQNDLLIFDQTTRRIHHFNLTNMSLINSTPVKNPELDHYLFYFKTQDIVFDLSSGNLSIFNSARKEVSHSLKFTGMPVSVAANESLGLFIVYDNLKSTGIVKLGSNGEVSQSFVGGPLLDTGETFLAGDLNSSGKLVVSLTGGAIAVIDTAQTLAQQQWIYSKFTPNIGDITWMAPLPDNPDIFMVKSRQKVELINITTTTLIDVLDVSTMATAQLSKIKDPHLLMMENSYNPVLIYAQSNQIKTHTANIQFGKIMYSVLDIAAGEWTFVENSAETWNAAENYYYNNADYYKVSRKAKKLRLSDHLFLLNKDLISGAQIRLTNESIFTLFSATMGYAKLYNMDQYTEKEIRYFNLSYLNQ